MSRPIMYHDQTLYEGILHGLDHDKMALMIEGLERIGMQSIDVPIPQIQYYALAPEWVQHLLRVKIRASSKHLELVRELKFHRVSVSYLHQPGTSVPYDLRLILERLHDYGVEITLNIENASAFALEKIQTIWDVPEIKNIHSCVYGDRDSLLDPFTTFENLRLLQKAAPCIVEFHAHNAYGFATANTLSALRAGIRDVATAVAGIGQLGHAAFEEVMMAATHLLKEPRPAGGSEIAPTSAAILAYLGKELPVDKAVIGENIFAHESGLHVYGIMKNPQLYEAFSPDEVGLSRYLVVGKHSGTTSLQLKLHEVGIELSDNAAGGLLKQVRRVVLQQKRPLNTHQLVQLVKMGGGSG